MQLAEKTYVTKDRVREAMQFAEKYHRGQFRMGADGRVPYYEEHILGVYHILKQECRIRDEDILVTALLHDTVEDTDCTFDDIERTFGSRIRKQVWLLSKLEGETFSDYSRRLFEHATEQVILIKLADRLHNLRTILYVSDKKWIQRKVNQTYTDILARLEQVNGKTGNLYALEIDLLHEKIEKQLRYIQAELDKSN